MPVRVLLSALSALCLSAALGGPANAAVVASDTFQIDDTFSAGTCEGPDGTVYEMAQHDVGEGWFHDQFRGPAAQFRYDEVWFGTEGGHLTSTYTNLTTGLSWSGETRWLAKDQRILEVDGNQQVYLRANTTHSLIQAPDGSVVARSDNRFEYTVSIDTKGTPDTEDDVQEFGELRKAAGRSTIGDFCEDALLYTVPLD